MNTFKVPKNYTEDEVLEIINRISNSLARKFRFGYHSIEDIKQQAVYFALISLNKYNGKHPLDNFLWVAVRNKLANFKRDNYHRIDKPCIKCPENQYKNGECCLFSQENIECCKWYSDWNIRNNTKKNLMETIELGCVDDEREKSMKTTTDFGEKLDCKEIERVLQENIPMEFYGDYDKFKNGAKLSTSRKLHIKKMILSILEEYGFIDD